MQVLTFAVAFNNPEHTGRLNLDIYIYIGTICSLSSKRVLHVYDVHQRTVSPFNSICGYVDYPFSSPFAKFLIWLIGLLKFMPSVVNAKDHYRRTRHRKSKNRRNETSMYVVESVYT